MPDFKWIYNKQADLYDRLVRHEDYEGNIARTLARIPVRDQQLNEERPFAGLDVVELGAGTGRLTSLLAPWVNCIYAFDVSLPMLAVATSHLSAMDPEASHWSAVVADNRQLPLWEATADVALAGWTLGHFVGWYPAGWRQEIGRAVAEMKRVLRPGGVAVILETLGTGHQTPQPPTQGLAAYYRWLEQEQSFATTWIRTDYLFGAVAEAVELTEFFFGETVADRIRREKITILPECTGIWWLYV